MIKKSFLALLVFTASTPASSQVINSVWPDTYLSRERFLYIHISMESGCDLDANIAASTWNNMSIGGYRWLSNVRTGLTTRRTTDPRGNDPRATNIEYGYTGSAVAETTTIMTGNNKLIDEDITVNEAAMLYGTYYNGYIACRNNGKMSEYRTTDYESVILHELGHAVGFGDSYSSASTSCAMYNRLQIGVKRRSLCAAEIAEHRKYYRGSYGHI